MTVLVHIAHGHGLRRISHRDRRERSKGSVSVAQQHADRVALPIGDQQIQVLVLVHFPKHHPDRQARSRCLSPFTYPMATPLGLCPVR